MESEKLPAEQIRIPAGNFLWDGVGCCPLLPLPFHHCALLVTQVYGAAYLLPQLQGELALITLDKAQTPVLLWQEGNMGSNCFMGFSYPEKRGRNASHTGFLFYRCLHVNPSRVPQKASEWWRENISELAFPLGEKRQRAPPEPDKAPHLTSPPARRDGGHWVLSAAKWGSYAKPAVWSRKNHCCHQHHGTPPILQTPKAG